MITFAILNCKETFFFSEYHYTFILYPSKEYNTLDITTRLLRKKLWQLKYQGLIINMIH